MDFSFSQWIIIHHYHILFWYSSCARFGHWKPLQASPLSFWHAPIISVLFFYFWPLPYFVTSQNVPSSFCAFPLPILENSNRKLQGAFLPSSIPHFYLPSLRGKPQLQTSSGSSLIDLILSTQKEVSELLHSYYVKCRPTGEFEISAQFFLSLELRV